MEYLTAAYRSYVGETQSSVTRHPKLNGEEFAAGFNQPSKGTGETSCREMRGQPNARLEANAKSNANTSSIANTSCSANASYICKSELNGNIGCNTL